MNLNPVGQVFAVMYQGDIEIVFDNPDEAYKYIEDCDDPHLNVQELDVWSDAEPHLT